MELYRFDVETAREITAHDSAHVKIAPLVRTGAPCQIAAFYLEPNGVLGYQPAIVPQLFCVVQGAGYVRGEDESFQPIQAGQAAFWRKDEKHETQTGTGLFAIVIEGDELNPREFLRALR